MSSFLQSMGSGTFSSFLSPLCLGTTLFFTWHKFCNFVELSSDCRWEYAKFWFLIFLPCFTTLVRTTRRFYQSNRNDFICCNLTKVWCLTLCILIQFFQLDANGFPEETHKSTCWLSGSMALNELAPLKLVTWYQSNKTRYYVTIRSFHVVWLAALKNIDEASDTNAASTFSFAFTLVTGF